MRRLVVIHAIVFLCVGMSWADAVAERPPSNMELATRALAQATAEMLAELAPGSGAVSVSVNDAPAAAVVQAVVAESLRVRGLAVVSEAASAWRLNVTVHRFGVTIPETKRPWLVGSPRARRVAVVELAGVATDSTAAVTGTASASAEATDWIPVSDMEFASGPAAMGLAPEAPRSTFSRWAEPLIVTGSVGAVLYLFFTK